MIIIQLLEDLRHVCRYADRKDLISLMETIQASVPGLLYDRHQWMLQIFGRLKFRENANATASIESLLNQIASSSSTRLLPNGPCFSKTVSKVCFSKVPIHKCSLLQEEPSRVTAIFRIPTNQQHVIALCDDQNQVEVWNIVERKIVRTLKGINQPRNLEVSFADKKWNDMTL